MTFYHTRRIQTNFPPKDDDGAFKGSWMYRVRCRYLVFTSTWSRESLRPEVKFLRPRSLRSQGRNYTQGVWVFSLRMLRNLRVSLGITLRCLRHNIHSYAYTFRFPQSCSLQSLFRGSWTGIIMCWDLGMP